MNNDVYEKTERKQATVTEVILGLTSVIYFLGAIIVATTQSKLVGAIMFSPVFILAIYLAYKERKLNKAQKASYLLKVIYCMCFIGFVFFSSTLFKSA